VTSSRSSLSHVLLGSALALTWLAMFLLGTGDVDLTILGWLYAGDRPILVEAARFVTLLGGWYFVMPVMAVAALIVWIRGRPWTALLLFVGTFVGRTLTEVQKYELGRLRPDQHPHLVNVYNLSFPSGHAANSMMAYLAIAMLLVRDERKRLRWTIAALLLSLVIGLSRIILGVHWPSDVVAGWSYGALWALFMLWLASQMTLADRNEGKGQ